MYILNGPIWVHRTGIQFHILNIAFTFPTGERSQQLRTNNNGKNTIPEVSDEKHYYYGYNIPRQLIYIFSWQWLSERNQGLDF